MTVDWRVFLQEVVRILLNPKTWVDVYWPASRKYFFSLLFIGVICAKALHLYSHLNSLTLGRFLLWGPTFFVQDVVCILIAQILCQKFHSRWFRALAAPVMIFASLMISGLAAANISFYIQTGAEIHWRQAHSFHRDAASVKTLLTGLTGIVIGEVLFTAAAWISTPYLYNWVRGGVRVLKATVEPLCICCKRRAKTNKKNSNSSNSPDYEQVAYDDWDEESGESQSMLDLQDSMKPLPKSSGSSNRSRPSLLLRILVGSAAFVVLLLRFIRPSETAYAFLSQTVIITPFEKIERDQTSAVDVPDLPGDWSWLFNHTALAATPKLDWLPDKKLPGFRDWRKSQKDKEYLHYDPAHDPLKISNLDKEVLEPLRDALKGGKVNIKHVFLLKLESTRADVFPLRKESYLGELIQKSYGGEIPDEIEERLANLTRNAARYTNTPSGFNGEEDVKPYGGMYMRNAYTGDTFTLKSILASVCGIAPLVVDFNREYLHHIYEPCMPQVFNALNHLSNHTHDGAKSDDFTTWPWHSTFMQSITDNYDNQDLLIPALGFKDKVTDKKITEDYKAKNGTAPEKYNFWGYPEHELREYFLNALKHAEKKHERVFLTHLTGQTHHPWDMPAGDEYEEYIHSSMFNHNGKVNRYLNTLGVADKWLGEVAEVLEEAGVADETLVVMVGDHGISLIEDGGVTPYDNPHVSNFHVPLVFSHPKLPPINIDSRVTSMQILPTIFDLLVESGSLDKEQTKAIQDLLPLYEGQSMIRETVPAKDGKRDWQFTVMNTGATWLALRSADKPYRLVIPLVPDVEWRFSNVDIDPHELDTQQSFNLLPLIDQVARAHDEEAVDWVKEAAQVTKWWVSENWRRYEYEPES
ncbi:hypothetical protein N7532_004984 [Penicillium argentinense]|uniref:Sulfatase N-terminal domain-containing protein n=1 Tax=Penicillium argentinense TaxID=1131581 RepID=A0A9W9FD11_9EURO|nr:uncharacterized protein N7532_004984 [Penicillium argentinense]KAJ5097983.1 hypothetical protein N7532_004984 [Penicillium argentinense]